MSNMQNSLNGIFSLVGDILGTQTNDSEIYLRFGATLPTPRFVTETRKEGEMELQEQFEAKMVRLGDSEVTEMEQHFSNMRRGVRPSYIWQPHWSDEGDASEAEYNLIEGLRPKFKEQASYLPCQCDWCYGGGSSYCQDEAKACYRRTYVR